MRLIGLHGPAHSGKDTTADRLCNQHGFARIALAGPIKDMLIAGFGFTREQVDGPAREVLVDWIDKSPRQLMQSLGTEWGRREVKDDLWLAHAHRRMQQILRYSGDIVVTDIHFENEADWLRSLGGAVWHIGGRQRSKVVPMHVSEHGIAVRVGVDSVINNSAGLEQLHAEVDRALRGECLVQGVALED